LLDQHKTHLVSTYTTLLQHLAEIRQVATTGKTPAGGRVAPLPEPGRDRLLGRLEALATEMERLVQSSGVDLRMVDSEIGGLAAARMWINVLLRTVEELIEDLLPSRMGRQYGALGAAEGERLQRHVEKALARLREAMAESEQTGIPPR